MKTLSLIIITLTLSIPTFSFAKNYPCSKKKGGVAYCSNGKFVCKDGSISGSKQKCVGTEKPKKQTKKK